MAIAGTRFVVAVEFFAGHPTIAVSMAALFALGAYVMLSEIFEE
ncbi:MAG: hypothetical protein P4K78_13555 [Terracidiphilus sp.]|nr:hypothetical protein [Terracidiphilus sp.]